MSRPVPEDLRLALENVPVNGDEEIVSPPFKTTLLNLVLSNTAAVQALVGGGPSGQFASALAVMVNISKAAAHEEITLELEHIRDQDPGDPNFTDPATFFIGKLRTSKGSPSARGVTVTMAGKLRILASGTRP